MPIDEKQITNKQHAVPQNIMEVEFKIIGEMTLREFIYLAVFGALAYFSALTIGNFLKWPMVFFFGGIGLIFAFLPINDRGMDEWVANFLRAIYNPTQKVWRKTAEIPKAFTFENLEFVRNELITLAPTTTRRKLENYLDSYNQQEEQKEDYEKKEEEFIKKVRDTYAYYKMEEKYTVQVPQVPVIPNVETEPLPSQLPKPVILNKPTTSITQNSQTQPQVQSIPALSFDIKAVFKQMNQQNTATVQNPQPITQDVQVIEPEIDKEKKEEIQIEQEVKEQRQEIPVVEASQQTSPVMQRLLDQINKTKEEQVSSTQMDSVRSETVRQRIEQPRRESPVIQPKKEEEATQRINLLREFNLTDSNKPLTPSITPDRVAGRMFTPLALNNEGEIILPIRGERVLKVNSQNEVDIEKQLEEKTKQLQQVLDQIRIGSGTLPKKGSKEQTVPANTITEAEKTAESINRLQAENQKLVEEMAKLKVEMAKASQVKSNFQQQEQIIDSAKIEQEVLLGRISELQRKLEEQTKKQLEEERIREEKRREEERKQEETLRLMIKMQKDKQAPQPGKSFTPDKAASSTKETPMQNNVTPIPNANSANTQTPLHASLEIPTTSTTHPLETPTPKEVNLPKPNPEQPITAVQPSFAKQQLTDLPNIITGVVKNNTGNVLNNVLVIIKRPNGDPVRALKTNSLGVFAITTPLSDGEYIVELDKSKHTGLTFNIVKIVLDGKVLPPLEFIGKTNV